MNDQVKSGISKSFKDVCVVENKSNGQGLQVIAYGSAGRPIATGDGFKKEGIIWDSFMDNMRDLLSTGGKATGDSYSLGNGQHGATYSENGIKIDLAKGTCDVTTVDGGQNPNKPVQLGVVLKGAPFDAMKP